MADHKKIAFIKTGSFSNINDTLLANLKKTFFDYQIDTVDITADLIDCRSPGNIVSCFREYGADMIRGRKKLYACLVRTPYFFSKVRDLVSKRLGNRNYAFTLQTQSIIDASIPGVPHFVYTDHTHLANLSYPAFNKAQLYPAWWIALERSIYQRAAMVFTMSSNISKSLVEQYACDPDKIATVFCGSNISSFPDEKVDDTRYSQKRILFVGVDWERKGGPQLLEAFTAILTRHPDAQLTIVGCSPKIDTANCRVVGKIPLSEVRQYYNEASVFCLPTRLEPFGIVFIEAFSHKVPIVATRIGAVPDIVSEGKNGFLVDIDDTGLLSQRLIELIGDPAKCKEFGQSGYAVATEKYSWEKTAQRIRQNIEKFQHRQHI